MKKVRQRFKHGIARVKLTLIYVKNSIKKFGKEPILNTKCFFLLYTHGEYKY